MSLRDALGRTETYSYSSLGSLTGKTDRNGNITVYTYDGLGRTTAAAVTPPGGAQQVTSYAYTVTGAMRSESNGSYTSTYTYDALGRVSSVSETGGVVKSYGYDIGDNRTSFTLTRGSSSVSATAYTYDSLARLATVSEGGALKATYTYDANGNRASLAYTNGDVTTYAYNQANWVTSVTNKKGLETLSSYVYSYYTDGNQRTKTDGAGRVTAYAYDGLGRLTNESESGSGGVSIGYTYDRFSNRTSMNVTGAEAYSVSYAYDANNRLTGEAKTENGTVTGSSYYYDANGNLTSKSTGTSQTEAYTYNAMNQLVSANMGGTVTTYTYRPDGLRNSKTSNGVTATHLWDGSNIAAEVSGGTTTAYLRGIGLISSKTGSNETWYLFNAHGDVTQLTSSSGAVTKTYAYDAFGVEKDPSGTDANPFRYCGEYFDKETGTYYLRARQYNPRTGRFTQEDPIRDGLNWYTYCGGNPVMFWDPYGLELIKYVLTTGAGATIDTETGKASVGGTDAQGRSWGYNTTVEKAQQYMADAMRGGIKLSYTTKPPVSAASEPQSLIKQIFGAPANETADERGLRHTYEAFYYGLTTQQMFFSMNYADMMYDVSKWAAEQDAITEADMLSMGSRSNSSLMDSKAIRFTQDSIKSSFKDGTSLNDTIGALKSGQLNPKDISPIRIYANGGYIYSLDNRRLYVAQQAGVDINYIWASPAEIQNEAWKFTTMNNGISIHIR